MSRRLSAKIGMGVLGLMVNATLLPGGFYLENTKDTPVTVKYTQTWCSKWGQSVPVGPEWWNAKGFDGVFGFGITGAVPSKETLGDNGAAIAAGVTAGAVGAGAALAGGAAGAAAASVASTVAVVGAGLTATTAGIAGSAAAVAFGAIPLSGMAALGGTITSVVAPVVGVPLVIGAVALGAGSAALATAAVAAAPVGLAFLIIALLSIDKEKTFSAKSCEEGGIEVFEVVVAPRGNFKAEKLGLWYDVSLVDPTNTIRFEGEQEEDYKQFHVPVDQFWKMKIK